MHIVHVYARERERDIEALVKRLRARHGVNS